jgi:hypothetical protein
VQNAFVTVVVVVGVVGVLGAVACLLTSRRTWESFGRNRLMMESDLHDRPQAPGGRGAAAPRAAPDTPAARAERDTEVRQMLQARNDRRRRRGQPELDLEAELRRLTATPASPAPAVDAELRDEVRALVIARNHRRARRGLQALDVESEIERELARLP